MWRIVDAKHVVPVNHDSELQQRRKKEEIAVARARPIQERDRATIVFICSRRSPIGFQRNFFAGVRRRSRARFQSLSPSPTHEQPSKNDTGKSLRVRGICPQDNRWPSTADDASERNVPNSMMPLPQESLRSGSNSGSSPYFDGPNSALPC